ncbi:MAG: hypothetical protein NC084_06355 [Bacteroides sp.]|nr:hypothetical protein [Eubacterium sp.]MCM1418154.1 hypothetical protein [Roseburia sp.]MCM1462321.1 hypothetical protein [Bacteroides sp.]
MERERDRTERIVIKPRIIFTQEAWIKMTALLATFSTEIAWHGVIQREGDLFRVTDILVFPQEVTGATVDTDEEAYTAWREELPNDVFCGVRMHAHSHVNMGVTPSSIDRSEWNDRLEQLTSVSNPNRKYYLFMIWNKSLNFYMELYDGVNMIVYEKNDCILQIEDCPLQDYLVKARQVVKRKEHTTYGFKEELGLYRPYLDWE